MKKSVSMVRLRPKALSLALATVFALPATPALAQESGGGAPVQLGLFGGLFDNSSATNKLLLSPEYGKNNGFGVTAGWSTMFGSDKALGLRGTFVKDRTEFIINGGWKGASGRLLLTASGSRLTDDYAFPSGDDKVKFRQNSVSASWVGKLPFQWANTYELNAYRSATGSRDLDDRLFVIDSPEEIVIYNDPRRLAGSTLLGFRSKVGFAAGPLTRVNATLGAERLEFDYSKGRESKTRPVFGIGIARELIPGLAIDGGAERTAVGNQFRLGVSHGKSNGVGGVSRWNAEGIAVRGRDGTPDDNIFRVTFTMSFGGGGAGASNVLPAEPGFTINLLDDTLSRPPTLPATAVYRYDRTLQPSRVLTVQKQPGQTVDTENVTVRVPCSRSLRSIEGATRNGGATSIAPFSLSGNGLTIRVGALPPPSAGGDQYEIRLANSDVGFSVLGFRFTGGDGVRVSSASCTAFVDTTPDHFTFADRTGIEPGSQVESAPITVRGIDAPAPITIRGGEYSINGGAYTSQAGTVSPGVQVRVRVTAPRQFGATASAILDIGGVSDSFDVTTRAAVTQVTPFTFADQTDVAPLATIESAPVTLAGFEGQVAISITGGEYSVNGGTYTNAPGTVPAGTQVRVRLVSSPNAGETRSATLTVGNVSDRFDVTTRNVATIDTTPDPFNFIDLNNVEPNVLIESQPVTITGINSPATVIVRGGEYSIDGGPYTSAIGVANLGSQVRVRVLSNAQPSGTSSVTLDVGGVTDSFDVTTRTVVTTPPDTTPDPFGFTARTDVTPGSTVASNSVRINGTDAPAPISITGGDYSVNGGPFTNAAGLLPVGATVQVRLVASRNFSTKSSAVLSIGGVTGSFDVTTLAGDTTPDPFTFTDITNAPLNYSTLSNTITVTGINAPTPISIAGGEYSIDGGPFTFQPGTVNNGQKVAVSLRTGSAINTRYSATLNIGGVTDDFDVTTRGNNPPVAPTGIKGLNAVACSPMSDTLPPFTDADNDPLTYSLGGLPAGLTFNPATLTVSGTPTGNWTPSSPTTFPLTYTATDGIATTSTTVNLFIYVPGSPSC